MPSALESPPQAYSCPPVPDSACCPPFASAQCRRPQQIALDGNSIAITATYLQDRLIAPRAISAQQPTLLMWQFAPEPSVALIPSHTSPSARTFAYTSFGSAESGAFNSAVTAK